MIEQFIRLNRFAKTSVLSIVAWVPIIGNSRICFECLTFAFVRFRLLVQKARKLAQEYMLIYEQNVPPTQLVKRVADVMQEYTQSGYVVENQSINNRILSLVVYVLSVSLYLSVVMIMMKIDHFFINVIHQ